MKKILLLQIAIVLFCVVQAQECHRVMNIHKNGEITQSIPLSDIDSITFSKVDEEDTDTLPSVPELEPTLIFNGDFETWTDGLPNHWKPASTAGNAVLSQSTDAHSGSYAVRVAGASGNKRIGYEEMVFAAGTYRVNFYVKAATPDGGSVRPGYATFNPDGGINSSGYKYGDYVNGLSHTEWTEVDYEFTLDSTQQICLVVMNSKNPGKDVLIDDYTISSLDGGTADEPAVAYSHKGAVAKRIEVPAVKPGNALISHWSVENGDSVMSYALEYDYAKYHSRWVAFRFDALTRPKNVGRKDNSIKPQYPADPYLSSETGLEGDALYGSGYSHGHLVASADRLYSRTANDNTFFMTNMSPQISSFNSPYWSALENIVQSKGRNRDFADTLYVCKGGTITNDKILGYTSDYRMAIPKYYFMALLKVMDGNYSAIGFWMEHKDYGFSPSKDELAAHALSIDELEELTGIDFFHNLPDAEENACESSFDADAWVY